MTQKTETRVYCNHCEQDITEKEHITTEGYPHFQIWLNGNRHTIHDGDFCDLSCYRAFLAHQLDEQ